jgi:hypothetical protein
MSNVDMSEAAGHRLVILPGSYTAIPIGTPIRSRIVVLPISSDESIIRSVFGPMLYRLYKNRPFSLGNNI